MASTNKTTTLNLSQFTGNDKPDWLTDYNEDMEKLTLGLLLQNLTSIPRQTTRRTQKVSQAPLLLRQIRLLLQPVPLCLPLIILMLILLVGKVKIVHHFQRVGVAGLLFISIIKL